MPNLLDASASLVTSQGTGVAGGSTNLFVPILKISHLKDSRDESSFHIVCCAKLQGGVGWGGGVRRHRVVLVPS